MKDDRTIDINNLPEGWKVEKGQRGKIYVLNEAGECVGTSCYRCGHVLNVESFAKSTTVKHGVGGSCKKCVKEYHEKNKDRLLLKRREHYQKNKDTIALYKKEYHEKNKDKRTSYNKKYYQKNKDKMAIYQKEQATKKKHNPVVYKITFEGGYFYIGQTINTKDRKRCHIGVARRGKHCNYFNELYKSNPEAFENAVNNGEIIKEFATTTTEIEITAFEYDVQLEALQLGHKLVGKHYGDLAFKMYALGKLGAKEAQRIIELSRAINEGEFTC